MFLRDRKYIMKKLLLASSLMLTFLIAIIGIVKNVQEQASAHNANEVFQVTMTKDNNKISYGPVMYDDDIDMYGGRTHRYTITDSGSSYTAFCANPYLPTPEFSQLDAVRIEPGTIKIRINENEGEYSGGDSLIKLMIYIATNPDNIDNIDIQGVRDEVFARNPQGDPQWLIFGKTNMNDPNMLYAYSHAVIGVIFTGNRYSDSYVTNDDGYRYYMGYHGLGGNYCTGSNSTTCDRTMSVYSIGYESDADDVIRRLRNIIENTNTNYHSIWEKAEKYDLYQTISTLMPEGGSDQPEPIPVIGGSLNPVNCVQLTEEQPGVATVYLCDNYGINIATSNIVENDSIDLSKINEMKYTQPIVWIEKEPELEPKASIKVQKRDADTEDGTPQGSANLDGILFHVYKVNDDNSRGDKVAEGSTINSEVTFNDLPLGRYVIVEQTSGSNSSYTMTEQSREVTLTTNGQVETIVFTNKVKLGSVKINKQDAELKSCETLGSASFAGITFQVINNSDHSIKYNNETISKGEIVIERRLEDADHCEITFADLPYGNYIIRESVTGTGYSKNVTDQTAFVNPDSSQTTTVTFNNQVVRQDLTFKKVDQNKKPMANIPFKITSKTTGEWHIVMTDSNGEVNTATNLHSNQTNGYDKDASNLDNTIYKGYGTWFSGKASATTTPNDSLGALPYDTYKVEELSCIRNEECNITGMAKEFTVGDQTVNLGTFVNNCTEYSISTTATDNSDGDKYVEAGAKTVIQDKITYSLKAGDKYTIKGVLMDKTTGKQVKEESVKDFTPTTNQGVYNMAFYVDTTELAGHELVVFESVYRDDKLVASHEDINDEAQTIEVIYLVTYASNYNSKEGSKDVIANGIVKIKDVVKYCLKAGREFTIRGTLTNKDTGKQLFVNGKSVVEEVTFTPEETCGELEMVFEFDATGLGGTNVVILENVYQGRNLIIEHDELDNVDESFYLLLPAPDTGHITNLSDDNANQSSAIIIVAVSIAFVATGTYVGMRLWNRSKYLR